MLHNIDLLWGITSTGYVALFESFLGSYLAKCAIIILPMPRCINLCGRCEFVSGATMQALCDQLSWCFPVHSPGDHYVYEKNLVHGSQIFKKFVLCNIPMFFIHEGKDYLTSVTSRIAKNSSFPCDIYILGWIPYISLSHVNIRLNKRLFLCTLPGVVCLILQLFHVWHLVKSLFLLAIFASLINNRLNHFRHKIIIILKQRNIF